MWWNQVITFFFFTLWTYVSGHIFNFFFLLYIFKGKKVIFFYKNHELIHKYNGFGELHQMTWRLIMSCGATITSYNLICDEKIIFSNVNKQWSCSDKIWQFETLVCWHSTLTIISTYLTGALKNTNIQCHTIM